MKFIFRFSRDFRKFSPNFAILSRFSEFLLSLRVSLKYYLVCFEKLPLSPSSSLISLSYLVPRILIFCNFLRLLDGPVNFTSFMQSKICLLPKLFRFTNDGVITNNYIDGYFFFYLKFNGECTVEIFSFPFCQFIVFV